MKRRRKQPTSDPVTQYAEDVLSGKVIAGPWVRAACKRHLSDLERDDLIWQPGDEKTPGTANYVIGFFRKVLRLNGGQFEGMPFEPQPWQQFILGSLFGWKLSSTGLRRFQIAYIEVGKSNGKSPLAAGVGLFMLTADNRSPR
jgi:phage terminase large subunit-like protein